MGFSYPVISPLPTSLFPALADRDLEVDGEGDDARDDVLDETLDDARDDALDDVRDNVSDDARDWDDRDDGDARRRLRVLFCSGDGPCARAKYNS